MLPYHSVFLSRIFFKLKTTDLKLYEFDCFNEKTIIMVVALSWGLSFVLCFNCTRFKFVALQINHESRYCIIIFYSRIIA